MMVHRLMSWMNSGSYQKLETKVQRLIKDVLQAHDFDIEHLERFSVRRSLQELDMDEDDWIKTDVTIDVPTKTREEAKMYTVPGFHYHPLVEVICAAFVDDNIQKLPKEPTCLLERVIAGLMFFSDATHLANFGTAKAWLLYLYFGNLTKYVRSSPRSGACHLVGFLPSVSSPDCHFLVFIMASLHTHCRRELFHACWEILLDEEFIHVYRHGMVLKLFPRIFTYSADYPEKVLIAAIRDMGSCACPCCLTPKSMFGSLGLLKDMKIYATTKVLQAREFIYRWGNTVDGLKVEHVLGEGSWIHMLNQFVNKLGSLGLDPFCMLVVDFMHKCELGTWKALFMHLIRLLHALLGGSQLVAILNSRFHEVPMFGNGVIQKFANNTSEMKRLAARDFEDILQVFGAVPPNHNSAVQSLLYRFAQWHALAKLQIHSDSTLNFLGQTFKKLSQMLQKFWRDTCAAFETMELPKEKAARQRRLAQHSESNTTSVESSGTRTKKFNLATYKFHAMGDYVNTIKLFGTTDSFTTQMVDTSRIFNLRTELSKYTPAQLAKHERRRCVLRRIAEARDMPPSGSHDYHSPADASPSTSSGQHHRIATTQASPINLYTFLRGNNSDLAVKNFIPKLKDHVLFRLRKLDISHCDHTFTDEEHNMVIIPNNMIYSVQTMQVYYTTYDLRREYDTINPRTHADVMVLLGELMPSHPYWYAQVLGIYHMETWLTNGGQPAKQHLEVLWVRWLVPLQNHRSSMTCTRLPKVAFVDELDLDAFGFLDPSQVIQGTHLIPAFASERGISSLRHGKSLACPRGELDDWEEYYVGIFVDRDMFMQYTHLGVGHPVMLWRITRDCLGLGAPADVMNVVSDDADPKEISDSEDIEELDEEDEEEKDEEDEDDEEDGNNGEDDGDNGEDLEDGDDGDVFDDLSF
ncbi:hypothetical protein BDR06DRAFT_985499 [Suillus hirtellus]|nr:hypothetical protein BDR06DRAFT_985499 [Suillus hirtellus]